MKFFLEASLYFSLCCIMLAMLFCTLRLLKGPSSQDRILALDTLWMCAMLFSLLLGISFSSQIYFEWAMLIALTGFVSSVALAKFLMRGEIIE